MQDTEQKTAKYHLFFSLLLHHPVLSWPLWFFVLRIGNYLCTPAEWMKSIGLLKLSSHCCNYYWSETSHLTDPYVLKMSLSSII